MPVIAGRVKNVEPQRYKFPLQRLNIVHIPLCKPAAPCSRHQMHSQESLPRRCTIQCEQRVTSTSQHRRTVESALLKISLFFSLSQNKTIPASRTETPRPCALGYKAVIKGTVLEVVLLFDVLDDAALLQPATVAHRLARVLSQAHPLEPRHKVAAQEAADHPAFTAPASQTQP